MPSNNNHKHIWDDYTDSDLIIGLVGAVGTDLSKIYDKLKKIITIANYDVIEIKISKNVIPRIVRVKPHKKGNWYQRTLNLMDAGDDARSKSGNNSILALGAAALIATESTDGKGRKKRKAYVINSLKRKEEVSRLRDIYQNGFYLLGVFSDQAQRADYLKKKRVNKKYADHLMERDKEDVIRPFGQNVKETFHLADFFIRLDQKNERGLEKDIRRIVDLLFGDQFKTPTFDEFAMYQAYTSALRSADLSRQVGAVIADEEKEEILGTGANDCPKPGGGLYWPIYDRKSNEIKDVKDGRDYMWGKDSNRIEQIKIINKIVEAGKNIGINTEKLRGILEKSTIIDLTEYGRVVHAEMEAIIACGRNGISCREGTLYCTTFPCHNCAKHIIDSGLKRVVYVEPYSKSKAAELHKEAISLEFSDNALNTEKKKVFFEPFVGVGARRFIDIFSMNLSSGKPLKRKDKDTGLKTEWKLENANLRIQIRPSSYEELEKLAGKIFNDFTIDPGGKR